MHARTLNIYSVGLQILNLIELCSVVLKMNFADGLIDRRT